MIETSLRASGVTLAIVLMLVSVVRGGWRSHLPLVWLLASVASYLVCGAQTRPCSGAWFSWLLLLLAIGFPFLCWRLARVVLEDDSTVPSVAWLAFGLLLVTGFVTAMDAASGSAFWRIGASAAHKLIAVLFLSAMLVQAWRSREGDLLASRRQLRTLVLLGMGAYSGAIMAVEVWLGESVAPAWLQLLNVALIVSLLLLTAVFLLGVHDAAAKVLFAPMQISAEPVARQPKRDDEVLIQRLKQAMSEKKLWTDSALSPASLASHLGVPEYALRKLINERLGHRNFSAFANGYRLDAVAVWLLDPALSRRPILTLALEAGFGSIGPFNRAFRQRFGVAPSEYRAGAKEVTIPME
jgi:AraC-like DNA-binding protein